jgi:SAM-dependent methyltransferase
MSNYYAGSIASYYDLFFPAIDEQEINFYARHIASCAAPALEIGCGTGRVLLELLKRGYDVQGFDCSRAMLEQCKAKAAALGYEPVLYEQRMQELSLPKQYGCIYSPLGTFQHIADRNEAQAALQKCYEHLLPNGILLVYLYLPWQNAPIFGEWHQHDPVASEDTEIIVHEKSIHDPIEQLIFSSYRYDIKSIGLPFSHEEFEQTTRWYSRYEFEMMLECAGFKDITVSVGYEDSGPNDVMLFRARR